MSMVRYPKITELGAWTSRAEPPNALQPQNLAGSLTRNEATIALWFQSRLGYFLPDLDSTSTMDEAQTTQW